MVPSINFHAIFQECVRAINEYIQKNGIAPFQKIEKYMIQTDTNIAKGATVWNLN